MIGNKYKKYILLILLFITKSICYSQDIQIDTIYAFGSTSLPSLPQSYYPDNKIEVVYADELIIDKASLYKYALSNVSHHLVIFANKITVLDKFTIDLSGSIFHKDYSPFLFGIENDPDIKNLCIKYGDSLINVFSNQVHNIYKDFDQNPKSEYQTYLKFQNLYKDLPYFKGGNLIISARQIIFDKKGFLNLISLGNGGGVFFVGIDSIILSSEVKLNLLNNIREYFTKSFFFNLYNHVASENFFDQIESSKPTQFWYISDSLQYSDIVKKGDIYDSVLINKLISREVSNFNSRITFAFLYNVNNGSLPFSRFHSGNAKYIFNAVMPFSDFMMRRLGQSPFINENEQLSRGLDDRDTIHFFDNIHDFPLAAYYSDWVIHYLTNLQTQINHARLIDNNDKLYTLMREISSLPEYKILSNFNQSYTNLLSSLSALKDRIVLPLNTKIISINEQFFNQNISLFSEKSTNKYLAEPTDIYIRPYKIGTKEYTALLDFNPSDPSEIFINFSGELSVNSLLYNIIKNKIALDKDELIGVFTNCKFKYKDIFGEGIINEDTKIDIQGKYITGRIACKSQFLELTMQNLIKNPGIILTVHWSYNNNEGDFNFPLTFTKKFSSQINIMEHRKILNLSNETVTVRYLKKNNEIYLLQNPVIINPDSSKVISNNENIQSSDSIGILSDGIEILYDDTQSFIDKSIKIIPQNQRFKTINIINNLSNQRSDGSKLLYLHIEITYYSSSDSSSLVRLSHDLTAKPSDNYKIKISLLNLSNENNSIEITGKAIYANGYSELKPIVSKALDISIDDSQTR